MMSHRRYFAAMAPLDRFSALPYVLDPPYNTALRASGWHLQHHKAHTDFATAVPTSYNSQNRQVAVLVQPLMDSDLSKPDDLTWWSFAQHREHYIADQALLPLQTGKWPFW
jgi:hypothetical protein